jgi:FKBP-type peptidyl-prolyl cis-trans isomerase FkpA
LLNGEIFAPTGSLSAVLSTLIQGWQIGLPHIATGGTILLAVPSALGYGSNASLAGIPPNSVLLFTITLNSFTN